MLYSMHFGPNFGILFFILQCWKNIVRLGLEKHFMKVGYYDTE